MADTLKQTISKIQTNRYHFVLFKTAASGDLVLEPKAPNTKDIQAMEAKGCKEVAHGRCFWDKDGTTLVFATTVEPQTTWQPLVEKVFRAQHLENTPVLVRKLGANEINDDPTKTGSSTQAGPGTQTGATAPTSETPKNTPPPQTGAPSQPPTDPSAALAEWQKARESVVVTLRALGQAFVEAKDPDARDGIILLQAIVKNLTPKPETKSAVAELERYIETDDIIDDAESPNPFGIQVNIRAPLLEALKTLGSSLPN